MLPFTHFYFILLDSPKEGKKTNIYVFIDKAEEWLEYRQSQQNGILFQYVRRMNPLIKY